MGSNIVSLTDREYMQRLQEKLLQDYADSMNERIKNREGEELDRVKNLVLIGKIPIHQAPPEMSDHPVMLIEKYCNAVNAQKKSKIKVCKVKEPPYPDLDEAPNPDSKLSMDEDHELPPTHVKLCTAYEKFLGSMEDSEEPEQEEYIIDKEQLDVIRYEDPLLKQLRDCETVEELYEVADQIIGALRTIDEKDRVSQKMTREAEG
ncbi:unnamed protein product [Callosobruchus maculatus]|uniref:Uncharacterized protein n=1 Tax=Callosobruchus maculatus TaxID=64391 RepID=A0A653CXB9_CALMS|nr:unnamed protein product [Callosobruchus maculatus]